MRLLKFTCDGCGATAETKGPWPKGWIEFNILVGQKYAVSFDAGGIHACSADCAAKGAGKHAVRVFDERPR